MKAIVSLTKEEYEQQSKVCNNLREVTKGYRISELLEVDKHVGYAHYKFSGAYNQLLVDLLGREPTSDEIIMLVDDGFSHFGASCHISSDRHFYGRVNTD